MQVKSKKAFTLIELLVVVLIIGILSAVALPQYKKAVEKSRATEAWVNLRALVNAEKIYKMANDTATSDLSALDIQLNGQLNEDNNIVTLPYFYYSVSVSGGTEGFEVIATRNNEGQDKLDYFIYYSYLGTYQCVARKEAAKWICETLAGHTSPGGSGSFYYALGN